ncbi:MAG: aminopeptidase [bacterium]
MSQESQVKQLKKQLMSQKTDIKDLSADMINQADAFSKGYKTFLNASPIEREAVRYTKSLAEKAGFEAYDPHKTYQPGDRVYIINREKAIGLAVIGQRGTRDGVKMIIAHIDSPRLDLKPQPLYEDKDLALFKTHYYGGIKKYQWTTIPLTLHGRVVKKDGSVVDIIWGNKEDESCFCVTDLLPHLAQEQVVKPLDKAFTGEDLNVLTGSRPYPTDEDEGELVKLNVLSILNKKYGMTEDDFLSSELCLIPSFQARDVGFDASMIGGYGQDDKVCAYPAIMAALDTDVPVNTCITYLTDKEETGSNGNTGMQSDFFRNFIYDMAKQEGEEGYRVLAKSTCISADVNAALDPTYASAYEARNSCYLNRGVVLTKYTGSRGKYSTSDASAEYLGMIRRIFDANHILYQTGEVGRVDLGGGGTIAKFVANMNVEVVDVGVPLLSMHAPFEIIAKADLYMAYLAYKSYYQHKH